MSKKWYKSKILWVNALGFIAIIASAVFARQDIANQIIASEAIVLTGINIVLRLITNQGLTK